MNNKIPKQLSDRQELQRQYTVNLVKRTIADLQSLNTVIKIKNLMEITGLSRSVFAKPHIRDVLIEAGIIADTASPQKLKPSPKPSQQGSTEALRTKLAQKDKYIAELSRQNAELKHECELLRGRLFLMMQKDG